MSFPASGSAVLYRNSIQEVSQFLDQKHPNRYRVYNLCCECLLLSAECSPCYFPLSSGEGL